MVLGIPLIELFALFYRTKSERFSFSLGNLFALLFVEAGTVEGILGHIKRVTEWEEWPHIKLTLFIAMVWGFLLSLVFLASYFFYD